MPLVVLLALAVLPMATDPEPLEHRERYKDINGEVTLRGIEQPYNQVRDALEALKRASNVVLEKVLRDPAEAARIEGEIQADLEEFRKRREQAQ